MSLIALLDAETPAPITPSVPTSTALRDAIMPDLQIDRTFHVTAATVDDLEALVQAHWAQQTGPQRERLIEIVMAPGTYDVNPIKPWCITRGETGDPADVIIAPPGQNGGVLHYYNGPVWARGLTLRALPTDGFGAKYPLHISAPGTLTFVDCNFEHRNPDSDGYPNAVGMDGFDGARVSFVGCTFGDLEGDAVFNIHGGSLGPNGCDIAFYDCWSENGVATVVGFSKIPEFRCDVYHWGGNLLPYPTPGPTVGTPHVGDWPAPVGGFANYERIQLGLP